MDALSFADMTVGGFLDATAAKLPTPGGGAVAGLSGAMSAALAGMVVSYSLGKKAFAAQQAQLEQDSALLARARAMFMRLAAEDAAAYGLVNELSRLPESDARRAAEMPQAARAAVDVPMAVATLALDLLREYERMIGMTNRHLRSDLAIAAVLAGATARSSWWNVVVNVAGLPEGDRAAVVAGAEALVAKAEDLARDVERGCREPMP